MILLDRASANPQDVLCGLREVPFLLGHVALARVRGLHREHPA